MPLNTNALLTLQELKDSIPGLTSSGQDSVLETFINATSDTLETLTGRRLKSRAYTNLYRFVRPGTVWHPPGFVSAAWLDVEWPITALTALAIAEEPQTIWMPGDAGEPDDQDVWVLDDPDPKHARDRLYRGGGWKEGQKVKLTYTAGYGDAGAIAPIPEDLKQAIKVLARDWYHLRSRQAENIASRSIQGEAVTYVNDALPRQFRSLIHSYRRWSG